MKSILDPSSYCDPKLTDAGLREALGKSAPILELSIMEVPTVDGGQDFKTHIDEAGLRAIILRLLDRIEALESGAPKSP